MHVSEQDVTVELLQELSAKFGKFGSIYLDTPLPMICHTVGMCMVRTECSQSLQMHGGRSCLLGVTG